MITKVAKALIVALTVYGGGTIFAEETSAYDNFYNLESVSYLIYPNGINDLDSYGYRFLCDPLNPDEEVREVAFCGIPPFINCPDRNWDNNFTVPETIMFQGREYTVVEIDEISTDKIHSLTIPSTVRRLNDFSLILPNLEILILPSSLQSMGYSICSYSYTDKIKKVEIAAMIPPMLEKDADSDDHESEYVPGWTPNYQLPFSNIDSDCLLTVPKGTAELYSQDPVFGKFSRIEERNFDISNAEMISEEIPFTLKSIPGSIQLTCSRSLKIDIYRMDGNMTKSLNIESGTTTLSLPVGLYILSSGNKAVKAIVR